MYLSRKGVLPKELDFFGMNTATDDDDDEFSDTFGEVDAPDLKQNLSTTPRMMMSTICLAQMMMTMMTICLVLKQKQKQKPLMFQLKNILMKNRVRTATMRMKTSNHCLVELV